MFFLVSEFSLQHENMKHIHARSSYDVLDSTVTLNNLAPYLHVHICRLFIFFEQGGN